MIFETFTTGRRKDDETVECENVLEIVDGLGQMFRFEENQLKNMIGTSIRRPGQRRWFGDVSCQPGNGAWATQLDSGDQWVDLNGVRMMENVAQSELAIDEQMTNEKRQIVK